MLLDDMIFLWQQPRVISELSVLVRRCISVAAWTTGKHRVVCFLLCLVLAESEFVQRHMQQYLMQETCQLNNKIGLHSVIIGIAIGLHGSINT